MNLTSSIVSPKVTFCPSQGVQRRPFRNLVARNLPLTNLCAKTSLNPSLFTSSRVLKTSSFQKSVKMERMPRHSIVAKMSGSDKSVWDSKEILQPYVQEKLEKPDKVPFNPQSTLESGSRTWVELATNSLHQAMCFERNGKIRCEFQDQ